jgi:hypothetical protein
MNQENNPQPVLNYASDRVIDPPTIWGAIIMTIISALAAIGMLFTAFYVASAAMFEEWISSLGASGFVLISAAILLSTIAAWLWFINSLRSLQSRITHPPGIAIFLMLIAIGIGLVDLAILITGLAGRGDAKTIDQRFAVVVLGLFALILLGIKAWSMWFAGLRRIRGGDRMD